MSETVVEKTAPVIVENGRFTCSGTTVVFLECDGEKGMVVHDENDTESASYKNLCLGANPRPVMVPKSDPQVQQTDKNGKPVFSARYTSQMMSHVQGTPEQRKAREEAKIVAERARVEAEKEAARLEWERKEDEERAARDLLSRSVSAKQFYDFIENKNEKKRWADKSKSEGIDTSNW